jgi:hypothetical protein
MRPALLPLHRLFRLGALALAAFFAPAVRADPPPLEQPNEGMGAIQYILAAQGLTPLSQREQLRNSPSRTVLIVLGNTDVLREIPDGLSTFLERGGALLVATDQDSRAATETTLRVYVTGAPVRSGPNEGYRGVKDCPVIRPRPVDYPLFRGVLKGIATNRPSYLRGELPALAWFPPSSRAAGSANLPFAAAAKPNQGTGQFLVLADHSIFIDGMMLQRDNDNFAFAYNCVTWLRQSPRGKRDRVLLIVDGEVQSGFGTPVPYLPSSLPAPDVDRALVTLEERDAFNRLLLNLVSKERLLQIAVVLLSFGLLGYGFFRLVRARHRVEEAAPLFAISLAHAAPGKSLAEQRQESALAGGNLWEAAHALADEFFASAGLPGTGSGPPRVRVRGGLWQRRGLTNQVHRLWNLTREARPSRVTRRRFLRLLADIDALKHALTNGSLSLEAPEK